MNEGSTDIGEIERELDQTRSRLDTTMDVLHQKLAPGSMVDQAVEYFSEGDGVELVLCPRDNVTNSSELCEDVVGGCGPGEGT